MELHDSGPVLLYEINDTVCLFTLAFTVDVKSPV